MKTERKTVFVSYDELKKIDKYLHEKYPYLYRENNLFSASVVDLWELNIDEDALNEVRHLMKPCKIKGFEL